MTLTVVSWYLAVQLAGAAAWLVLGRAFTPLTDRGWAVSKALGLLLLAWPVWFVCMLTPLPFGRVTLMANLLACLLIGIWMRRGRVASGEEIADTALRPAPSGPASLYASWRQRLPGAAGQPLPHLGVIVALELIFALALVGFLILRAHDPAITGTEKPMDMTFLNALTTSNQLPAEDAWLSGYGEPYYYFGYLLFASVAKLTDAPASVAYNLAAATVPALAIVGLAGLAWSIGRALRLSIVLSSSAAILAPVLVMIGGNLSAAFELLVSRGLLSPAAGSTLAIKDFAQGVTPGIWPPSDPGWWFRASRIIPNLQPQGIDEFPFFSAYLSDLHPHFMALPIEVVIVALGASLLLGGAAVLQSPSTRIVAALLLGVLVAANTWDIPSFWLLFAATAWIASRGLAIRTRFLAVGVPLIGGVAMFLPYFVGYGGPPLGLGLVSDRTPVASLLVLFGPNLALVLLFGLWMRWRARSRTGWAITGLGILAVGIGWLVGEPTVGLLAGLLLVLFPWDRHAASDMTGSAETLVLGLAALGVALLLGVELVFVRDAFGTRMNTVFKLDYNAWLFLGFASALIAVLLVQRGRWMRPVAATVALLGLAGGLVYPVSAIDTRLSTLPIAPGSNPLDGAAFLPPDEVSAVAWLHTRSTMSRPTIIEAVSGEYTDGGRMSTYSGDATALGWSGHELQWRGPLPILSDRETLVREIYTAPDRASAVDVIQGLRATYVIVGDLERQVYGSEVTNRFDGLLPLDQQFGSLKIYDAPS